ncbi:MAG: hypothetical protein U1E14_19755 [Geminicoccaceae bacterium]
MAEYILLMHDDAGPERDGWDGYIAGLVEGGHFRGGSAIGAGLCVRRAGAPPPPSPLTGFIRIEAADLAQARALLAGNPAFEAGGTVEIRALPRTD